MFVIQGTQDLNLVANILGSALQLVSVQRKFGLQMFDDVSFIVVANANASAVVAAASVVG